ncbi:hypothetical protein QBC44DRAFT_392921 [Cladorrhinum sp. PSN332]|nr:hypothetical protein QBC44DRAFT_392921 [Cladorrhinum sp. PSN332]
MSGRILRRILLSSRWDEGITGRSEMRWCCLLCLAWAQLIAASRQDEVEEEQYDQEYDEEEEEEDDPPYTAQELGAIFIDFYKFLATLHYDRENLKIPPPEGWKLPRDMVGERVTDFAFEVMRHLPYFKPSNCPIDYKSELIDYTSVDPNDLLDTWSYMKDDTEFWGHEDVLDPSHVFPIALGYESNGVNLFLCPLEGCLYIEYIRSNGPLVMNVEERFAEYKERYRNLELIPFPGKVALDLEIKGRLDEFTEAKEKIAEEDVLAQEEEFPTVLDVQYLKQIYREYGWPLAFRREECFERVETLLESIAEKGRGGWEDQSIPRYDATFDYLYSYPEPHPPHDPTLERALLRKCYED